MSLAWGPVIILFTFVTPALLLLATFRIVVPKQRSFVQNDLTLLAFFCLISAFVNGDLIAFAAASSADLIPVGVHDETLRILKQGLAWPHKPLLRFLSSDTLFSLIAEFHIRVIFVSICLYIFAKLIDLLTHLIACYLWEGLADFLLAPYLWFLKIVRPVIYHPWGLLTQTSFRGELVMVDLLTTEGSLFSGILTSYVPNENSMSAMSLKAPLRYHGSKKDPASQKLAPTEISNNRRKISLVKNHGELVVLAERIETIHFWGLPRNFKAVVNIYASNDVEILKWFVAISQISKHVKKVTGVFNYQDTDELYSQLKRVLDWLDATIDAGKLKQKSLALRFDVPHLRYSNESDFEVIKRVIPVLADKQIRITVESETEAEFAEMTDRFFAWVDSNPEARESIERNIRFEIPQFNQNDGSN